MTTPALIYEQAKREFAAGEFNSAVAHARDAETLVLKQLKVEEFGPRAAPRYSIILVTYKDTADVRESFSRVSRYNEEEDYEIIVINNGNASARSLCTDLFSRYKYIDIGFNYGCSGARNVGVRYARGEYIIFVDDDGFIDEGSLETLIQTITEANALMVRGRVLPKTSSETSEKHYDLGDKIVASPPNAECLLICRRDKYIEHGGFDALLAGHEGWALCSKMYPSHGPESFLYSPKAIIHHDYASDDKHRLEKKAKFRANLDYLREYYPLALDLMLSFQNPEAARAKKMAEIEARLAELQSELASTRRRVKSLSRQLTKVVTSTSCRITSPLRVIVSSLRRSLR